MVKFGFINIHASLLPKWRGAAPIQRAIMNGDKKSGISIMKIQEKLDSGPVLALKEIGIDENKTFGEIEKKLSIIGAELLIDNLKIIKDGNAKFVNQLHTEATYAKKIDKKETKINWSTDAYKVLYHIHGLSPNPGAWFEYKKQRYKVWKAKIVNQNGDAGKTLDDKLTISCKDQAIKVLEIQKEGKNKQVTEQFLLGNKINQGENIT